MVTITRRSLIRSNERGGLLQSKIHRMMRRRSRRGIIIDGSWMRWRWPKPLWIRFDGWVVRSPWRTTSRGWLDKTGHQHSKTMRVTPNIVAHREDMTLWRFSGESSKRPYLINSIGFFSAKSLAEFAAAYPVGRILRVTIAKFASSETRHD